MVALAENWKNRNNYTLCTNVIQNIFTDPAIVLSMIIVSFIFVMVCGLDLSQICPGFLLLLLLYLCCCWWSNYQDRHGWDPLTSFTLPHFCAYAKLGPGFPTWVFLVFSDLWGCWCWRNCWPLFKLSFHNVFF